MRLMAGIKPTCRTVLRYLTSNPRARPHLADTDARLQSRQRSPLLTTLERQSVLRPWGYRRSGMRGLAFAPFLVTHSSSAPASRPADRRYRLVLASAPPFGVYLASRRCEPAKVSRLQAAVEVLSSRRRLISTHRKRRASSAKLQSPVCKVTDAALPCPTAQAGAAHHRRS